VLAEASVEHRAGTAVGGLLVDRGGPVPVVRGVTVSGGGELPGTVVAATGRRGDVPAWLAPFGVEIPETTSETGLVYLTRWYRLAPGAWADTDARLGGDLGYVKYLAVPGDGDTLSATIAVRARDSELRAALADPNRFDAALARLPGPDRFFATGPMTPIGPVRPMAGLVNRIRRFTDTDGAPRVLGLHAVGDAHTCTNPIYGRGCALALVQAVLLAEAFAAAAGDPAARAVHYEAACRREVEPWYHLSVQMDDAAREMARTGTAPVTNPLFTLFTRGGTDPVVGRGLLRVINLLARPEDLLGDPELMRRAMAVLAEPPGVDEAIAVGPTRDELLDSVAA
jgi:2-polyprenyl-6-methoxyphenol hydroxylase-like FAD-dependent oxidoreductase